MGSQLEYFDGVQSPEEDRVSQNPTDGPSHKTWTGNGQLGSADSWRAIAGNAPRKPTGGRFICGWAMDWLIYNLGWSKVYIYFSAIFSFLVNLAPSNHGFVITRLPRFQSQFCVFQSLRQNHSISLAAAYLWGEAGFTENMKIGS
jgi:hypothetical protein